MISRNQTKTDFNFKNLSNRSTEINIWYSEPSDVISRALNSYCSLPCPFSCPCPSPSPWPSPSPSPIPIPVQWPGGGTPIGLRRPQITGRSAFDDSNINYYDDTTPEAETPPIPPEPTPPAPKAKPIRVEDSPPPPIKKKSSSPPPTRRFFTSLCSIPGAIVDTLLSGEIVI